MKKYFHKLVFRSPQHFVSTIDILIWARIHVTVCSKAKCELKILQGLFKLQRICHNDIKVIAIHDSLHKN